MKIRVCWTAAWDMHNIEVVLYRIGCWDPLIKMDRIELVCQAGCVGSNAVGFNVWFHERRRVSLLAE